MAGPGDLFALADELLSFAAEALNTIPNFAGLEDLDGAPPRQVVTVGLPVDDCDQLSVYVPLVGEMGTTPGGLAASLRTRTGRMDETSLNIRIIRCCMPIAAETQSGDPIPPTPAQLHAAAQQIYADGWALWNHLHNVKASGEFLTLCDQMYFDGIQPVTPSGGCGGWVMFTRAHLDGYAESLGS